MLLEHERILQQRYGLRSLTRCIPDQHNGIFDDQSEALAVHKIVEMGRELVAAGCKALLMSGAAYPGLALLRAVVAMPVVSAGNSAARLAAHVGLPMAVMGIGVAAPASFRTLLGEHVPYGRPRGVTHTIDLLELERLQGAVDCAEAMMKARARYRLFVHRFLNHQAGPRAA